MATKHTDSTRPEQAALNDSALILAVEDGNGHGYYVTMLPPTYDGSAAMQTALAIGIKYDALRKAQSVAKKAAKEGKNVSEVLASWTFSPEADNGDRIETVGTKRMELAAKRLEAALIKANQPHNEATVKANLGKYLAKDTVAQAVDAELRAYLAQGYTPTKRGEGGAKTGEVATEVDLDSLI